MDKFSEKTAVVNMRLVNTLKKSNIDSVFKPIFPGVKEDLDMKKTMLTEYMSKNPGYQIYLKSISPLRYPGGKTRACAKLWECIKKHYPGIVIDTIYSPFFGGGSFEFYVQTNTGCKIVCNDKFTPLYNFWNICADLPSKASLCHTLDDMLQKVSKSTFRQYRETIMEDHGIKQAHKYFVINRCSFSGSTLSGGFSKESSKKRFTQSSIDRIRTLNLTNFQIHNKDFSEFLSMCGRGKNEFMFLDPPYYLEKKSKLYGSNGDMHEHFDHKKLNAGLTRLKDTQWIMTYNNSDYIKTLYKKYTIIDTNWSYGMNKSKKSSEIIILSICLK